MAKRDEQNGKRRFFSAEFKLEAVRWMRELGAAPVSLSQVDRELGVRPDMLRAWAKQAEDQAGATPRDIFPSADRSSSPAGALTDPETVRTRERVTSSHSRSTSPAPPAPPPSCASCWPAAWCG